MDINETQAADVSSRQPVHVADKGDRVRGGVGPTRAQRLGAVVQPYVVRRNSGREPTSTWTTTHPLRCARPPASYALVFGMMGNAFKKMRASIQQPPDEGSVPLPLV
eukprot:128571-Prymnesium_polylepis.1